MKNSLKAVPKGVLFDMDGTMFDTERIGWEGLIKGLEAFGYDVSEDLSEKLIGCSYPMMKALITDAYGENAPMDEIMEIREFFMQEYIKTNGLPEKKGLRRLISFLVAHHIKIAVVSANEKERIYQYLELSGLFPYIDLIVCAQELSHSKPDPESYLLAAEMLGLKPHECLVIEDSPLGAQAGINAKMPTVMIPDMVHPTAQVKKKVYAVYPSLNQVVSLLKRKMPHEHQAKITPFPFYETEKVLEEA